jgi:hypothetical protein
MGDHSGSQSFAAGRLDLGGRRAGFYHGGLGEGVRRRDGNGSGRAIALVCSDSRGLLPQGDSVLKAWVYDAEQQEFVRLGDLKGANRVHQGP